MAQEPVKRSKSKKTPSAPAPAAGGDTITGSIGTNAQGAAIGKNIFQNIIVIGSVKIPLLPILILILLVLAAIIFFGLRLLGPAQMSGSFNLAVANFGQLDAAGQVSASDRGELISRRLFEGLKIELDSLSPSDRANFQPQVWHDSLDITQKRTPIGVIGGKTADERWKAACRLAAQIHAHVMIYGNLPADGSTAEFIPEFAICDNPNLRLDADEIVGSQPLIQGMPVQLINQMGRPDTDLAVNLRVNGWTQALSMFSIGIMYDLRGRSDLALKIFQQARDQVKDSPETVGEVLWFFLGREELILSARTAIDGAGPQNRAEHLANARAAFEEALKQNPGYARAQIGLGGVFFSLAQDAPPLERLLKPELAAAEQAYLQAIALAPASAGALIEPKARLGLATVRILQGEALRDSGRLPEAGAAFQMTVQSVSEALPPISAAGQYRLLAQAYLTEGEGYHELGHLSLLQGDPANSRLYFEKASASYGLCIQQKDAAITDQTLADKIVAGLCVPNKKSVDASLVDLGKK